MTDRSERGHAPAEAVIELSGVSVCYRLPKEKITSFKEFAIRTAQRRISYENFWALKDVTLSLQRSEMVGIVGANGAGKSTLLKTVARVLRPTQGRVVVRGRVAPLLELGAGFDYELTGRENIFLNGALLGLSRAEMRKRFDGIVAFAELSDFIDAPLRTYSTGMVARLGFAIATDCEPEVLIVDEVLAVGDEQFQQKCRDRMRSFRDAGATILLVSHNANQVQAQCDRAVWLEHGRVKDIGPAPVVIRRYKGFGDEAAPDDGFEGYEMPGDIDITEEADSPPPGALLLDEPFAAAPVEETSVPIAEEAAPAEPGPDVPDEPFPAEPEPPVEEPPPPVRVPQTVNARDTYFGIWLWKYLQTLSTCDVPVLVFPGDSPVPGAESHLSHRQAAVLLCAALGWLPKQKDRTGEREDTFLNELARRGIGLIPGPDRTDPNEPLTRAELAVLLCRVNAWSPVAPRGRFEDVPPDSPFAGYVEVLAEREITLGTGQNQFSPDAFISWRHAAIWLEKTFGVARAVSEVTS